MAKNDLTAGRLRELLHYDAATGIFTRLTRPSNRVQSGDAAGCMSGGYRIICCDDVQYLAHRLAWLYITGAWPIANIDHIDGRKANNRFSNLRDVSRAVNQQNMRRPMISNKSSGVLGVSWSKHAGKWRASLRIAGKATNLGYFATTELAHAAYLAAKRIHHVGCTI